MSSLAIRIEGLGKQYHIGEQQARYRTFRDSLSSAVVSPFRRARSLMRGEAYGASNSREAFWALRNLSFDIDQGEVVGIIGQNGAGKSTLLKLISRITEPTAGSIDLYGRVGSLLEVGTGFHQELTGRENVYLNGAILGMTREEIDRKFDEIIDFSGIEKFIDTPVKHYSSGMGLRLGFAVAAHLEPEILIIDEVLAVGDATFQKKCIDKMQDVAQEGRTVLFVSHNMSAISTLCPRSILLRSGEIVMDGSTEEVVGEYLKSGLVEGALWTQELDEGREGQILSVALETPDGGLITGDYDYMNLFRLRIDIHLQESQPNGRLSVSLRDMYGVTFLFSDVRDTDEAGLSAGYSRFYVEFPGEILAPKLIYFTVHLSSGNSPLDTMSNGLQLQLHDFSSVRGQKRLGFFGTKLAWWRESIAKREI